MRYEAVLFDKDGTLFEYVQPFQNLWQMRLAERGYHSTPEAILDAFVAATERVLAGDDSIDRDYDEYRAKWMRICLEALSDMEYPADAFEAADAMWHALVVEKTRPYPDTVEMLDLLSSSGVKMGLVSNHNVTLEHVVRAHGLAGYFGAVIPSASIGITKPDPRIFLHALDRLGVAPERALFVGDTYEHDIIGARSAGMDAVFMSRDGRKRPPNTTTIRALPDLLPLL